MESGPHGLNSRQQAALVAFFRAIAWGEFTAEKLRLRLREERFDPWPTFRCLIESTGAIDNWLGPEDMFAWLSNQAHGLPHLDLGDVLAMLAPFSHPGRDLRYPAFLRLVASRDGPAQDWHRAKAQVPMRIVEPPVLLPEVAHRLCELLAHEIELSRRLAAFRKTLLELDVDRTAAVRFLTHEASSCGPGGMVIVPAAAVRRALVDRAQAMEEVQFQALMRRFDPSGRGGAAIFDEIARLFEPLSDGRLAGLMEVVPQTGLAVSKTAPSPCLGSPRRPASPYLNALPPRFGRHVLQASMPPRYCVYSPLSPRPGALKEPGFVPDESVSGRSVCHTYGSLDSKAPGAEECAAAHRLPPMLSGRRESGSLPAKIRPGRCTAAPQQVCVEAPAEVSLAVETLNSIRWSACDAGSTVRQPHLVDIKADWKGSRDWRGPAGMAASYMPSPPSVRAVPSSYMSQRSVLQHTRFGAPQRPFREPIETDSSARRELLAPSGVSCGAVPNLALSVPPEPEAKETPSDPLLKPKQRPTDVVLRTIARQVELDTKIEAAKDGLPPGLSLEALLATLRASSKEAAGVSDVDLWHFTNSEGIWGSGDPATFGDICAFVREVKIRQPPGRPSTQNRLSLREVATAVLPVRSREYSEVRAAASDAEALSAVYLLRNSDPCIGCGLRAQRDSEAGDCPCVECPACGAAFRCRFIASDTNGGQAEASVAEPLAGSVKHQLCKLIDTTARAAAEMERDRRMLLSLLAEREVDAALKRAFSEFGAGRTKLAMGDFRRVLFEIDVLVSEPELDRLWHRYASDSDGVSLGNFVRNLRPVV